MAVLGIQQLTNSLLHLGRIVGKPFSQATDHTSIDPSRTPFSDEVNDADKLAKVVQLNGRLAAQSNTMSSGDKKDFPRAIVVREKNIPAKEDLRTKKEDLTTKKEVQKNIKRLRSRNSEKRRIAAERLGELGDPSAIDPLFARVFDWNRVVALSAVRAIAQIGGARAVSLLITVMNSPHEYLMFDFKNLDEKYAHYPSVKFTAIVWLGFIGDERDVVEPLISMLGNLRSYEAVNVLRELTTTALQRICGPRLEERLLEAVKKDIEKPALNHVITILESITDKGPRRKEVLIAALDNSNWQVRLEGAQALSEFDGSDVEAALMKALKKEENQHVYFTIDMTIKAIDAKRSM